MTSSTRPKHRIETLSRRKYGAYAERFYRRFGFETLITGTRRMFLPVSRSPGRRERAGLANYGTSS